MSSRPVAAPKFSTVCHFFFLNYWLWVSWRSSFSPSSIFFFSAKRIIRGAVRHPCPSGFVLLSLSRIIDPLFRRVFLIPVFAPTPYSAVCSFFSHSNIRRMRLITFYMHIKSSVYPTLYLRVRYYFWVFLDNRTYRLEVPVLKLIEIRFQIKINRKSMLFRYPSECIRFQTLFDCFYENILFFHFII